MLQLCCYHAVGVISKKHSIGGRKLLVSCDTTVAENDVPQVAPCIPPDLQVEFLAKFRLKLLNLFFAVFPLLNICVVNFFQEKLKRIEMLIVWLLLCM